MSKCIVFLFCALVYFHASLYAEENFEKDIIKTSRGDLEITFIGHGTLMFKCAGKVIHVDPWSKLAAYNGLPKADIVLVTHEHRDHLDVEAINAIRAATTAIFVSAGCMDNAIEGAAVMKNGESKTIHGITVEAMPAYNVRHKRDDGQPFHPKERGNGYVITWGDKKIYIAGDTEDIPEMKNLKNIDIAFLPVNLPYTMTPEMVANSAQMFNPKILYPYHLGNTNTAQLEQLLKKKKEIDVRMRKMQ